MKEYRGISLIGVPYEGKEDFLSGASLGPSRIRWGFESIEDYSIYQGVSLPPYRDLGDIQFPCTSREEFIKIVKQKIDEIEPPFIVLGGNHLITLPVILSLNERLNGFHVIHLDAHLDRRDEFEGEKLSYATVIKRVEEVIGEERVFTFGYRSKAEGEDEGRSQPFHVLEPLKEYLSSYKGIPVYLTVDLDVLDPSEFPAVSNPEPGGISFKELLEAFSLLKGRLIAADIVEFNPLASPDIFPAVTASLIVRELLIILQES